MSTITVHHGDSRDVLKTLADNSIAAVVCDPPYALVSIVKRFGKEVSHLEVPQTKDLSKVKSAQYSRLSGGFMGQKWDNGETAFSVEFWAEVMRVLKPGGHVVAASGTRTYHRLACAIEDAGFEIRDMVGWLYGSGFPKSHDVSKGIDRAAGAARETVGEKRVGSARKARGGGDMVGGESFEHLRRAAITVATTPEAAEWEGWGTALKPAQEPWVLARKPLERGLTVAGNVLKWGTGALNIDGCRVDGDGNKTFDRMAGDRSRDQYRTGTTGVGRPTSVGRWPANIVHDGSAEVLAAFPQTEPSTIGKPRGAASGEGWGMTATGAEYADAGSAARFFYSAKADAEDRLGSKHPTVKPVDLMQWLCRLVTPPGGVILDPFAGSGSTGIAALNEGFDCILVEREEKFVADINRRLAWARGEGKITALEIAQIDTPAKHAKAAGHDMPLFGGRPVD